MTGGALVSEVAWWVRPISHDGSNRFGSLAQPFEQSSNWREAVKSAIPDAAYGSRIAREDHRCTMQSAQAALVRDDIVRETGQNTGLGRGYRATLCVIAGPSLFPSPCLNNSTMGAQKKSRHDEMLKDLYVKLFPTKKFKYINRMIRNLQSGHSEFPHISWLFYFAVPVIFFEFGARTILPAIGLETTKPALSLHKIIELPAAVSSATWSPDSRRLLFDLPFMAKDGLVGRSQLLDVETGKLSKLGYGLNNGLGHFFWSPDGKYIAVTNHGELRVVTYPGFQEVGAITWKDRPCKFLSSHGAGFTNDGKAIWVACDIGVHISSTGPSYLAAVKISIPGLQIADRFMAPIPRKDASWLIGRNYVAVRGDEVTLNGVLDTRIKIDGMPNKGKQDYFASYELASGKSNFPAFRIQETGVIGRPLRRVAYSGQSRLFAAAMFDYDIVQKSPTSASFKRITRSTTLMIVDVATHKTIATFPAYKSIEATDIQYLTFSRSGRLLIAFVSKDDPGKKPIKRTAVVAWNANDGLQVLSELYSGVFTWMELSPNGHWLAGMGGKKIYVFNIAE